MRFLIVRKKDYEKALKEEGHITNLVFTLHKSRSKDTIRFNPAFNLQLKTKIRKIFKLLDKHFPKNLLAKVFNRNMMKLSYSCTGNLKNVIKSPKILEMERSGRGEKKKSNCRNENNCPLDGECYTEGIIYTAEVSDNNCFKKTYIGCIEDPFKKRFYNHASSFRLRSYRSDTKFADCVWKYRERYGRSPCVKWNMIRGVIVASCMRKRNWPLPHILIKVSY